MDDIISKWLEKGVGRLVPRTKDMKVVTAK
jgi:hypothetical protein